MYLSLFFWHDLKSNPNRKDVFKNYHLLWSGTYLLDSLLFYLYFSHELFKWKRNGFIFFLDYDM